MNKDSRHLTQEEREMLIISPQQLLKEFYSRTQVHFTPDPAYVDKVNSMACLLKCVVCSRIPLEIRQCVSCEAVICKQCKHELIEEENFDRIQDLADELNESDL